MTDAPGFLVCGVEEPLGPNQMLHALDEATGIGELAEFACPDLNRYSFVWFGEACAGAKRLDGLFEQITTTWNAGVTLLYAWVIPEAGGSRADELMRQWAQDVERWCADEVWSMRTTPDRGVALKRIAAGELKLGSRWCFTGEYSRLQTRAIVLLGDTPGVSDFWQPPAGSLRRIGHVASVAPSQAFLEWLGERNLAIAYRQTDDLRRVGVVLAGPRRVDLPSLVAAGLVNRVHAGAEAGCAWRYGPNAREPAAISG